MEIQGKETWVSKKSLIRLRKQKEKKKNKGKKTQTDIKISCQLKYLDDSVLVDIILQVAHHL